MAQQNKTVTIAVVAVLVVVAGVAAYFLFSGSSAPPSQVVQPATTPVQPAAQPEKKVRRGRDRGDAQPGKIDRGRKGSKDKDAKETERKKKKRPPPTAGALP